MSPLQCASGMRCTARAVASPSAMEALVLCTNSTIRSFWDLSCSSRRLSRFASRFSSRLTINPMMALGIPIAATKPTSSCQMSSSINGFTPFQPYPVLSEKLHPIVQLFCCFEKIFIKFLSLTF